MWKRARGKGVGMTLGLVSKNRHLKLFTGVIVFDAGADLPSNVKKLEVGNSCLFVGSYL